MNYKEKMDAAVKEILGVEYTCVVDSERKFSIFENNDKVAVRETVFELGPHWRHELAETLKVMYDEKVREVLRKHG